MVDSEQMFFFAFGVFVAENPERTVVPVYSNLCAHDLPCFPMPCDCCVDRLKPEPFGVLHSVPCQRRVFLLGLSGETNRLVAYIGRCSNCDRVLFLHGIKSMQKIEQTKSRPVHTVLTG